MQALGETVFLVDMDPQRSLATSARGRSDRRLAGAAVGPERLGDGLATLRARAVTLPPIDTPASLCPATDAAVLAADLILVPVRPTAFGLWAADATSHRVRDLGRDCAFVLNQCPTVQVSRRLRTSIEALDAMGALLAPLVTAPVDYQDAMSRGLGPAEIDPAGQASREIRLVCRGIRRRMDHPPAIGTRGERTAALGACPH